LSYSHRLLSLGLIQWARVWIGDFWHRLRHVRGVTRNTAGRETGNDDECYDGSWYKTHHYLPPVFKLSCGHDFGGNATR
jgi:hypothetical protein